MRKIIIDNGQAFDFGKTSKEYAKYRDIYPKELYDRLYGLGVGKKGTDWLDLGTGTGVIPRGLAEYGANIVAADIADNQIQEAKRLSVGFDNITYRVCPVEELDYEENCFDVITACQCFWYFDPEIIVPKIRSMLRPGGMFLKIYMSYLKDDPVASQSNQLVRKLNPNWGGASASLKDLTTHFFEHPHMDSFFVDIPFTREKWHGRMKSCRGVLASMDENTFARFEEEHGRMLEQLPDEFTVRHKVFLTYYYIK